jgi:hypothetical protein
VNRPLPASGNATVISLADKKKRLERTSRYNADRSFPFPAERTSPPFTCPGSWIGSAGDSIEVINPFNRKVKTVAVSPGQVHTMVFWSKDFGPFLEKHCCGERLQDMGYHLFFNFTVNARTLRSCGTPCAWN